jgi:DivIVA domain-containing protein
MSAFKTVAKGKLGYAPAEVDSFIARARDQYNNFSAQVLDWRDITGQKFTLVKGGYEIAAVDSAIDKLQDTFAERELGKKSNPFGAPLGNSMLTELRGLLLGRASRPKNKRFAKAGVLGVGYSRKEVDALLTVVQEFLDGDEDLSLDEIRSLNFKVKRGGYFESQVDAYVERLVEYLQTRRFSEPVVAAPSWNIANEPSGFGNPSFPNTDGGPSAPNGPYSEYE